MIDRKKINEFVREVARQFQPERVVLFGSKARGDFDEHYYTPVEGVGIFWHIVDLIWIYLFPILYLIG